MVSELKHLGVKIKKKKKFFLTMVNLLGGIFGAKAIRQSLGLLQASVGF